MKKFYSLKNDIIFKNTFSTEESLKRLIEETLGLKVSEIHKNNIELSLDNKKERRKYLDLILKTDKGIINVEVNHGYKEELPNRNLLYLCKLLSQNIKTNNSYVNVDKHIQLNISWNLKSYVNFDVRKRKIIKFHISDDLSHNKIYDDVFEIVHINMDYFKDVWYHGNIKDENKFLMLLAADKEDDMDKICKGDRLMESINKKVKNLNEDEDILDVIIENEDEIIANSMYEKGIEKGIQEGVEKGIKEGINEGKLSQKKEIAKKMIKDGLDIKTISKYSGLSIDEIKRIK